MFYNSPILQPLINAAGKAQQPAVLFTGKFKYTAGELFTASKHLASQLAARGMKKDDMIVIAIAPGVNFITII